jgi:hypothetical protein
MILTKIISVIHFAVRLILSVIHLLGCLFLTLYLLVSSLSYFQTNSMAIREGDLSTGEIIFDFAICFAFFVPSISSIYLLAIRWLYPENNKMAHIKLINKIIYYFNFVCWTVWLIFGIWGIIALESFEPEDDWQLEIYMGIFSAGIIIIPMSVSGIFLFLFSTEFWRQDLKKLFKAKSRLQVEASA